MKGKLLLIAPYGIEIGHVNTEFKMADILLIAPYGIEMEGSTPVFSRIASY